MPSNNLDKAQLRQLLRQRRKALSAEQQAQAANAVLGSVADVPHWPTAHCVALYIAADGEIGTEPLAQACLESGKHRYLPVICPDKHLEFALWEPHATLAPNHLGIPEPPSSAPRIKAGDLDLVFLPLVGWDCRGGRLGMGGGYYDRTLAAYPDKPVRVGLAHHCQQTERLACDAWDINLNFVATDAGLISC
tara:strand:+ start:58363 stop:58938 length:576 start_codon:yes stop_codon:yes gene_type:complete